MLIHTVSEAHYFFLFLHFAADIRLGVFHFADFCQHFHDGFIGSAVKRSFKAPMAAVMPE